MGVTRERTTQDPAVRNTPADPARLCDQLIVRRLVMRTWRIDTASVPPEEAIKRMRLLLDHGTIDDPAGQTSARYANGWIHAEIANPGGERVDATHEAWRREATALDEARRAQDARMQGPEPCLEKIRTALLDAQAVHITAGRCELHELAWNVPPGRSHRAGSETLLREALAELRTWRNRAREIIERRAGRHIEAIALGRVSLTVPEALRALRAHHVEVHRVRTERTLITMTTRVDEPAVPAARDAPTAHPASGRTLPAEDQTIIHCFAPGDDARAGAQRAAQPTVHCATRTS